MARVREKIADDRFWHWWSVPGAKGNGNAPAGRRKAAPRKVRSSARCSRTSISTPWTIRWPKRARDGAVRRRFRHLVSHGGRGAPSPGQVQQWTTEAGLTLHPTKTRIVDATQRGGFDFLGYHFERGYNGRGRRASRNSRTRYAPRPSALTVTVSARSSRT